jgi:hypothetical protein
MIASRSKIGGEPEDVKLYLGRVWTPPLIYFTLMGSGKEDK